MAEKQKKEHRHSVKVSAGSRSGRNFSKHVNTEEDIDFFVSAIEHHWSKKHTKDTDNSLSELPAGVRYLIWTVTAYLKENVEPSDMTIDSMLKLLETCEPVSKSEDKTTFDLMVEQCDQKNIKERYKHFKYRVFGIHSNCYRETVKLSVDVLKEMKPKAIIKAIKKAKKQAAKSSRWPWKEINELRDAW